MDCKGVGHCKRYLWKNKNDNFLFDLKDFPPLNTSSLNTMSALTITFKIFGFDIKSLTSEKSRCWGWVMHSKVIKAFQPPSINEAISSLQTVAAGSPILLCASPLLHWAKCKKNVALFTKSLFHQTRKHPPTTNFLLKPNLACKDFILCDWHYSLKWIETYLAKEKDETCTQKMLCFGFCYDLVWVSREPCIIHHKEKHAMRARCNSFSILS